MSQGSIRAQTPCTSICSIPMNAGILSCFCSELAGITKSLKRLFLHLLCLSSPQNVHKWKKGYFSIHCMERMKAWHTSELCTGIWVGLGKSTGSSGKHIWVCVWEREKKPLENHPWIGQEKKIERKLAWSKTIGHYWKSTFLHHYESIIGIFNLSLTTPK